MCYFKLKDVSYKYPLEDREILKNINLDIKKGEFWAVIGKNGSGKTTLCNVLRRFVPDFYKGELKGKITLEGKELKDYSAKEIVQKVGFVFQNPFNSFDPKRSIGFSISEIIRLNNTNYKLDELAKKVGINPEFMDKYPSELSGGELQRLSIARALAGNPEVFILDEPTSALDVENQKKILDILKEIKDVTIIFISHDMNVKKNIEYKKVE